MSGIYNFKRATVVPSAKEFIDIVLSKTQRKTPTVVHKGYHISRIRQFYMKKVKYTQKTINEKLSTILTDFPRVDDIHPFYGDLLHVLYDRDHLKVALGQVSAVRHIVDNVGRDYVRLMKYGDSLYRCKQLKRAALGRMATACKKLGNTLTYLEKVRQHLSRLPSIDPSSRTLLVTGFPNVGKSSFMNKVTRADVDVQPYAFTTKSLYVGHTDFNYQPWQVIDTPGILDHTLEERNVVEMQAITALAHLRACILFFMDLSTQCGYTIPQQLSLFRSIRPLFADKPLIVVFNKSDACTIEQLEADEHDAVMAAVEEAGAKWITTSTLTEQGVGDLKTMACEALVAHRATQKEGTARFESMQNRLYCAEPTRRDNIQRDDAVPATVLEERAMAPEQRQQRVTEKDLEWQNGGPGQYQADHRKTWDLEDPSWNDHIIPEFLDGKNIADYIDPDIADRLIELEAEEERRVTRHELAETKVAGSATYDLSESTKEAVDFIRDRIKVIKMERAMSNPAVRRSRQQAVSSDKFNARTGTVGPSSKKRTRSASVAEDAMARDRSGSMHVSTRQTRGMTGVDPLQERSLSVARGAGFKDVAQKLRAAKLSKIKSRVRARQAKRGEADHHVPNLMPKHLFSGKMKTNGKRDRR